MRRQSTVRGWWRRSRAWLAGIAVAAGVTLVSPTGVAEADEGFRCGLKESQGVSEADARTAAGLICEHLRAASSGRVLFEISLAALGKTLFVTVTRQEPPASETVRIDTIEEIPVAAERLAEALVHGQPFVSTQRVDNLLEGETRPALSKKGSLKFLVGVADVESPGHGARAAGFTVGILYAAPRFALPAEMRFAWDDATYPEPGLSLFSISVGGRAYLSKRDVSPFVGGGLGILRLHAHEGEYPGYAGTETDYFDAERFGVAPYLEAGVEMLRLHRGRVALHVRTDLPTGSLKSMEIPVYSYGDSWDREPVVETVYPAQTRYVLPVSIGVTVAF